MKNCIRLCSLIFAVCISHVAMAQDCEGRLVSYGEVRAGFHAGFTAGRVVDTVPNHSFGEPMPLADGFWLNTFGGDDQRGFIDPESGSGWLCEGDWALVSSWFAVPQWWSDGWGLSPAETLALVNSLLQTSLLVDGVEYGTVELRAKPGSFVDPVTFVLEHGYVKAWGVFFEPGSLANGFHTVEVHWRADFDCPPFGGACDGDYETDVGGGPYQFEVLANP